MEGNSAERKGIVYEKRPSHFFAVVSLVHPPIYHKSIYICYTQREAVKEISKESTVVTPGGGGGWWTQRDDRKKGVGRF